MALSMSSGAFAQPCSLEGTWSTELPFGGPTTITIRDGGQGVLEGNSYNDDVHLQMSAGTYSHPTVSFALDASTANSISAPSERPIHSRCMVLTCSGQSSSSRSASRRSA